MFLKLVIQGDFPAEREEGEDITEEIAMDDLAVAMGYVKKDIENGYTHGTAGWSKITWSIEGVV